MKSEEHRSQIPSTRASSFATPVKSPPESIEGAEIPAGHTAVTSARPSLSALIEPPPQTTPPEPPAIALPNWGIPPITTAEFR